MISQPARSAVVQEGKGEAASSPPRQWGARHTALKFRYWESEVQDLDLPPAARGTLNPSLFLPTTQITATMATRIA